MLQKLTQFYAIHKLALECDIYTVPEPVENAPVFLFFHAGALTGWGRDCVPPWLVQTCYKQGWPLISVDYCLMPQTGTDGLTEDAQAAYAFAREWQMPEGQKRQVIVGGASAGFFLASFLGRTASPPPIALFSIAGINSFTSPFYDSSVLLTPEPTPEAAVQEAISGPLVVGSSIPGGHEKAGIFRVEALTPDGTYDPHFQSPEPTDPRSAVDKKLWGQRELLYSYYIHRNLYPGMTAAMDGGREWHDWSAERKAQWPPTVIFHGNADTAVPLEVSSDFLTVMGADRVFMFVAQGQDHLFERARFIEEDAPGMEAVRDAVARLSSLVKERMLEVANNI